MRHLALGLALLLAGCGTKFGASLGDMGYYHKTRCDKPYKLWIDEGLTPIKAPGRKRLGGIMHPASVTISEGHWHYYC